MVWLDVFDSRVCEIWCSVVEARCHPIIDNKGEQLVWKSEDIHKFCSYQMYKRLILY
jgi:hypothetical protein